MFIVRILVFGLTPKLAVEVKTDNAPELPINRAYKNCSNANKSMFVKSLIVCHYGKLQLLLFELKRA